MKHSLHLHGKEMTVQCSLSLKQNMVMRLSYNLLELFLCANLNVNTLG